MFVVPYDTIANFSTDSSMECSLENDENNFLLRQASAQTNPNKAVCNNLDKPFGMDLSVEFGAGAQSNRSSITSQVSNPHSNL